MADSRHVRLSTARREPHGVRDTGHAQRGMPAFAPPGYPARAGAEPREPDAYRVDRALQDTDG
ncbi:hypothetical protein [Paenibacillus chitinolyticus]